MSADATRMQDLASEFSKIFRGDTPDPTREGATPPAPTPSLASGRARAQAPRCWDPNLGPPQLFSRGCAPVGRIVCSPITTFQTATLEAH